jgi:DNA-binding response OmpR family regulator
MRSLELRRSASDAIKTASELKPDLILMDIGLAGDIDGIAVASAIRGQENIPVVFLTAYSDDATLDRAMKASPFGYILKPFEPRAVEAVIRVALYRHSKELEDRTQLQDALGQTPPPRA